MEDKAREKLALNTYLALLENPHIAFGVKQKTPETLDVAVAATLELESYLSPKLALVSSVEAPPRESEQRNIGVVSHVSHDKLAAMFEKLVDRFDKLEASYSQTGRSGVYRGRQEAPTQQGYYGGPRERRTRDLSCWTCSKSGYIARQCRSSNKQPSEN